VPSVKLSGFASNLTSATCNVTVNSDLLPAPVIRSISLGDSLLAELGLTNILAAQSSLLLQNAVNKALEGLMEPTVTGF